VGLPKHDQPLIRYFPNPATDNLNLQFSEAGERAIRIINSLGETVLIIKSPEKNISISLSSITTGFYSANVLDENSSSNFKFIVQR
jgi:hypothetical protein